MIVIRYCLLIAILPIISTTPLNTALPYNELSNVLILFFYVARG